MIIGSIDLTIEKIELSSKNPKKGEPVTISMDISNKGTVEARDMMITVYNLTGDGQKIEIGSQLISIPSGNKITVQKDMNYPSDFHGLSVEAKIKGRYGILQDSFTTKELGIGKEQDNSAFYILVIIIVLIVAVLAFFMLKKGNKKKKENV